MVIQQVSPGIITQIKDLSAFVQNVPSTIGFIVILSEKGPDNELVYTNSRDFRRDFGNPDINYNGLGYKYNQGRYVANNFLTETDSLYVLRAMPDDADFANLVLTVDHSTSVISASSLTDLSSEKEIEDTVETGDTNLAIFYGIGRGEYYNNYKIDITQAQNLRAGADNIFVLDVYQKQERINSLILIDALDSTANDYYSIVESFEVSFNPNQLDAAGESMFVEDVINNYSSHIRCKANRNNFTRTDLSGGAAAYDSDFETPITGATGVSLANGSDGVISATTVSSLSDRQLSAAQTLAAAYAGTLKSRKDHNIDLTDEIKDTDDKFFDIIFDAGYPMNVKHEIVGLAVSRKDCVAIIDQMDNRSVTDATTQTSGSNYKGYYPFNTLYAARYDGFSKIYDEFTGTDIWLSPVYHMAKIIPYNDSVGELWYAPAGFVRGGILDAKELRYNPGRTTQRNVLYLKQINPIVRFNVGGYTVFSQLTTQVRASALQDLNVVRLILYIKRALERNLKFYIFEPNDDITHNQIKSSVEGFLKEIQNRRGLYKFDVQVGANDYEIKAKRAHVDVTLQPVRALEQIYLTFFVE